jgi:Tol biopolymer transport system component
VSLTPSGGQIPNASNDAALSSDGRYVAFLTTQALVAADTNTRSDVYVRDRVAGTTTLASLSAAGVVGDKSCSNPWISGDGRYVVFDTDSTNYLSPDANGLHSDVFVRDLVAGTTTLVSQSSGGAQGNSGSSFGSISADGRWIAFESGASNLVSGDSLGVPDVFLRDRVNGTTTRVSVGLNGNEANSASLRPVVSSDGRFVAYDTSATNIVANDTTFFSDVIRYDTQTGTSVLVSVALSGQADQGDSPSISADGRFVAFDSAGTNLVTGDTNGLLDVFVRDLLLGTTVRASLTSAGAQITSGNGGSPRLSGDGTRVVFHHTSSTIVAGDTNGNQDIFLRDLAAGTTTRENVSTAGVQANGFSQYARISADGRVVAFESGANNLVAGDTNGWNDVFARTLVPPGPSLAKGGTCPGAMTLSVAGATPGGLVALLYGPAGTWVKPNPPCAGLTLQIFPPTIGAFVVANGSGAASLGFTAPVSVCGVTVQAVDVPACKPTPALVL